MGLSQTASVRIILDNSSQDANLLNKIIWFLFLATGCNKLERLPLILCIVIRAKVIIDSLLLIVGVNIASN